METLTITVEALEDIKARGAPKAYRGPRLVFTSTDLLLEVLTSARLKLVQCMTGAGPLSIREIARRLGRDVHAVHSDVTALLKAGVIRKDGRKIVFPYDAVRLDVTLTSAAA